MIRDGDEDDYPQSTSDEDEFVGLDPVDDPTHHDAEVWSVPTIDYYRKTYANAMGGDDQKAVKVFRDYESQEKFRRLQSELMQVKNSKVRQKVLDRSVGKKRSSKYGSYEKWAGLMLLWLISKRR